MRNTAQTLILDRATARLPAMLDDVRQLIQCESPSEDLEAVGRSAGVVAAVGERLLGQAAEELTIDGVAHLRWRFGDGPRRVLLLAHHDTVWPIGTLQSRPFAVTDGVMTGPGCFDMLTGVVQAFHALVLLRDEDPAGLVGRPGLDGVTLLVTGDEEVGSSSSRQLIEEEAKGCDAAFVLEAAGPRGALKTARKGMSTYRIHIAGRAAHAGLEPERGINAGLELAHQLLKVLELGDADLGTSVTPTAGRIGTTTNTVPAQAELAVDVRATWIEEQLRVDDALKALKPVLKGAIVTVLGGLNRPPLEESASNELMAHARVLAHSLGIKDLTGIAVGGASDGNFTAGMGVPTLDGLGAVGHGAHADDEYVLVEHIPARTALLALLIAGVIEGDGDGHRD